MSDGLGSVGRTVESLRSSFGAALSQLSGRVEHGIEVAEDLREDVAEARVDLDHVAAVVASCEAAMLEASAKQDVTMRGVQLLCGVVAESLGSEVKG